MGDNPGMTLYAPTRFVFDYVPSRVIETFTGAAFYALKGWRRSVHYEHVLTIPSHKELDEIAKFVAEGKIRVVLDQVFPLAQAIEAYKRSDSGKAVGKVVVEVMKGG
jgi:NADPH:quinone reductase-like Zn-dependent oxidoreductase